MLQKIQIKTDGEVEIEWQRKGGRDRDSSKGERSKWFVNVVLTSSSS